MRWSAPFIAPLVAAAAPPFILFRIMPRGTKGVVLAVTDVTETVVAAVAARFYDGRNPVQFKNPIFWTTANTPTKFPGGGTYLTFIPFFDGLFSDVGSQATHGGWGNLAMGLLIDDEGDEDMDDLFRQLPPPLIMQRILALKR